MELVVRKNDLLRELQLFQGIVERKNTIPILANVLMDAKGSEVRLLATDLEVGLRSTCAATVAKGGTLTLPAKKFYEIVKSLPETDIRIAEEKGGVKVAADRFDSRMQTLPKDDFPDAARGRRLADRRRCRGDGQGDGRQDAVRDHRRRHALLPERRAVRAGADRDDAGRDRRAPPGAGEREARGQGQEGRRGDAGDPAEEDARRTVAPARRGRRRHRRTSAARTTCSSRSAAAPSSPA